MRAPLLSGIVVHWHNEDLLAELLAAWPGDDPRFELVVVDNGHSLPLPEGPCRYLEPGCNLGFAGGVNAGARVARGESLLLLNPDAHPLPGALDALLAGLAAHPEGAGLAPCLIGEDGTSQHRWQLGRLPGPGTLLGHILGLASQGRGGAGESGGQEPPPGTAIEQPAAAALLLRREVFAAVGGLDTGYYPAWFEDVDLAHRLREAGREVLYWPRAVFRHRLGASVPRLGYGPFLWVYYRNLCLYLRRHHGPLWAAVARGLLIPGMLLRLAQLPLRRPRRAASRREGAAGAGAVLAGTLSGWRWPGSYRRRFAPPGPGEER